MSKKVNCILLSAAMLVGMVGVGAGAVTASADDTFTYYFLAPDNYFKTEAGASNTSVGAYWWEPESKKAPDWPGVEITAAPEVGENVFKLEGLTDETTTVIFNAFVDAGNPADPALAAVAHQTVNINTEGYSNDCPYDKSVKTDDFNGWIYVLANDDDHKQVNEYSGAITTEGAWFTLDDYKNNETYYGSYGFGAAAETDSETTAESDTAPVDTTGEAKYHAGDTVTAEVQFGGITCNGEAGLIGAYNYEVTYNADVLEYVGNEDKTTGGMPLANGTTAGLVKLGNMAAMGLNDAFGGEKATAVVLNFNVKADTNDLGLDGKCTSLSGMSKDASATETLVGVNNPEDKFSDLKVTVDCPHQTTDTETETDTAVEPTTDTSAPVVESDTDTATKPADTDTSNKGASDTDANKGKDTDTTKKATDSDKKATNDKASSSSKGSTSSAKGTTGTTGTTGSTAAVQTAGTFAVVSLVVLLMAAAAVVLYTRKKTEE